MTGSYAKSDIKKWLKLTPEERLFAAEELWKEFLIKYPKPWEPFYQSFDSFEQYHEWLKEQKNPALW